MFDPVGLEFQVNMLANEQKVRLTDYHGIVEWGRFKQRRHEEMALDIEESCPLLESHPVEASCISGMSDSRQKDNCNSGIYIYN